MSIIIDIEMIAESVVESLLLLLLLLLLRSVLYIGVEMMIVGIVRSVDGSVDDLGLVMTILILGYDSADGSIGIAIDRLTKIDSDNINDNPQYILRN
jgi:hypothetical protein